MQIMGAFLRPLCSEYFCSSLDDNLHRRSVAHEQDVDALLHFAEAHAIGDMPNTMIASGPGRRQYMVGAAMHRKVLGTLSLLGGISLPQVAPLATVAVGIATHATFTVATTLSAPERPVGIYTSVGNHERGLEFNHLYGGCDVCFLFCIVLAHFSCLLFLFISFGVMLNNAKHSSSYSR